MIYLKAGKNKDKIQTRILILEPGNIEAMMTGTTEKTPDGEVLIAYTPDAAWLTEQLIALGEITPDGLDRILKQSQGRPAIKDRPYHPNIQVIPGEKGTTH